MPWDIKTIGTIVLAAVIGTGVGYFWDPVVGGWVECSCRDSGGSIEFSDKCPEDVKTTYAGGCW